MDLRQRLGLEHPVIQAGMGGGLAAGELAGAVSAAGGLGTVGIMPPDDFLAQLRHAQELAPGKPVAANLLVPFARRGHVEACAEAGVPTVVLHAGFDRALVERLRGGGALVLHTVGTADEARRALGDGADGLIAQGVEAGGHLVGVEPAQDTLARVLEVAGDAPALAAGGVADAADVRRALDAGAAGAVAGTRFLLTDKCPAHPEYKRRVLAAERTLETLLFGMGWPMRHRVVPNAATERWCRRRDAGPRAVTAFESLTAPLGRVLPVRAVAGMVKTQNPLVPIFGPATAMAGMPDRLVDATPLYAGETALRIDSVLPAAEAVRRLAGGGAPRTDP